MLLFVSVFAGLIVGASKRGSLMRLCTLSCLWLPIITLASSSVIRLIPDMPFWIKAAILSFSYICIILFAFANRRYLAPSIILALGSLSNFLVIAVNGFRMPVSEKALSVYSGITAQAVTAQRSDYFIATNGTGLLFLGDVIYIPIPVLKGFLSIGDILISIGMFVLILVVMTDKNIITEEKTKADS